VALERSGLKVTIPLVFGICLSLVSLADSPPQAPSAEELARELSSVKLELKQLKSDLEAARKKPGFRSLLGEAFDLGGEIEIEFVDLQSKTETVSGVTVVRREEDSPFLRVDKVRLSPEITFTGKGDPVQIYAQGDLDFLVREQANVRARVKEFHITFEGEPADWLEVRLRLGLEDPFMRPPHDTEFWPLAATAFWRREAVGFFFRTRAGRPSRPLGRLNLYASVTNGYRLDDREPGEGDFDIVSREARISGNTELRELGIGVGWEKRWLDEPDESFLGRVQSEVLGFYYNDSMADDDKGYLEDILGASDQLLSPAGTLGVKGRELWGGNMVLEAGGLSFVLQVLHGRDGKLKRNSGYVECGYRFTFEEPLLWGEYLRSVKPLVRYGWLRSNLRRTPFDTRTWDRTRWTFAVITELRKNVYLLTEYALNREKTGGVDPKDPNTNEFLAQIDIFF